MLPIKIIRIMGHDMKTLYRFYIDRAVDRLSCLTSRQATSLIKERLHCTVLARHRSFASFLSLADMKGHYHANELLIPVNLSDSTYSIYENCLNIMKTAFIVAASISTTTTTTIPAAPQQQVAASPSLLDGLLVYAPLLPLLIFFGSIIAALITRDGQWLIHRDSKQQKKQSENHIQTAKYETEIAEYWQNYLATNSSLLCLKKDVRYHDLVLNLSSSAKDELFSEFTKYEEKMKNFYKFDLPKLRVEAEKRAKHERQALEKVTNLPVNVSLEKMLYSQNMEAFRDDAREDLEKPLRDFLSKELAELRRRNYLQ